MLKAAEWWKGLDPSEKSHHCLELLSLMLGEQNLTGKSRQTYRTHTMHQRKLTCPLRQHPQEQTKPRQETKKLGTFLPTQVRIKLTMALAQEKMPSERTNTCMPWWHNNSGSLRRRQRSRCAQHRSFCTGSRLQRCCRVPSHVKRTSHNITGTHIRTAALPIDPS